VFKSLYFKRWGIETKYDELKNKFGLQKFTGDTPIRLNKSFTRLYSYPIWPRL